MDGTLSRKLLDFLNTSPTCYHAADNLARQLTAQGYTRLWEHEPWELTPGGRYFVLRGDAALAAFRLPRQEAVGFMAAAAHGDSPTFKIRQQSEAAPAGGLKRLSVEPYGGMISRSWLDRPLSVAGRVVIRTERGLATRLVNVERDLLVIPSVAIHLDREVNKGTALKANTDLLPILGTEKSKDFTEIVAESLGIGAEKVVATEELVGGARLDDLQCAFGCFEGFLQAEESASVPLFCLFDHEEVGSGSRQGADSTFLQDVTGRICERMGWELPRLTANSFLVSADNAHALHPAHPEYADKNEYPVVNGGVVVKYNANQKYTTDAVSGAVFLEMCREAGVSVQRYSNRADLPGGSTLGNISTAHFSVPSVDIGLAQLAMHAAYEVSGAADTEALVRVMTYYFGRSLRVGAGGMLRWN